MQHQACFGAHCSPWGTEIQPLVTAVTPPGLTVQCVSAYSRCAHCINWSIELTNCLPAAGGLQPGRETGVETGSSSSMDGRRREVRLMRFRSWTQEGERDLLLLLHPSHVHSLYLPYLFVYPSIYIYIYTLLSLDLKHSLTASMCLMKASSLSISVTPSLKLLSSQTRHIFPSDTFRRLPFDYNNNNRHNGHH